MLSEKHPFRSYLTIGSIGLLALSLAACNDSGVSQDQGPAPAAQVGTAEPAPAASPPPAPAEPAPVEPLPHYDVHFTVRSAQLSDAARETLKSAADYLRAHPTVNVKLSGFTDQLGPAETNMLLAEQRAKMAARYLEESGIDASRIATVAVGEADPGLAPAGENPATWNRRVEIEFSRSPTS